MAAVGEMQILFSVYGGSSISAGSGAKIVGDLDSIVRRINENPYEIKYTFVPGESESQMRQTFIDQLNRIRGGIKDYSIGIKGFHIEQSAIDGVIRQINQAFRNTSLNQTITVNATENGIAPLIQSIDTLHSKMEAVSKSSSFRKSFDVAAELNKTTSAYIRQQDAVDHLTHLINAQKEAMKQSITRQQAFNAVRSKIEDKMTSYYRFESPTSKGQIDQTELKRVLDYFEQYRELMTNNIGLLRVFSAQLDRVGNDSKSIQTVISPIAQYSHIAKNSSTRNTSMQHQVFQNIARQIAGNVTSTRITGAVPGDVEEFKQVTSTLLSFVNSIKGAKPSSIISTTDKAFFDWLTTKGTDAQKALFGITSALHTSEAQMEGFRSGLNSVISRYSTFTNNKGVDISLFGSEPTSKDTNALKINTKGIDEAMAERERVRASLLERQQEDLKLMAAIEQRYNELASSGRSTFNFKQLQNGWEVNTEGLNEIKALFPMLTPAVMRYQQAIKDANAETQQLIALSELPDTILRYSEFAPNLQTASTHSLQNEGIFTTYEELMANLNKTTAGSSIINVFERARTLFEQDTDMLTLFNNALQAVSSNKALLEVAKQLNMVLQYGTDVVTVGENLNKIFEKQNMATIPALLPKFEDYAASGDTSMTLERYQQEIEMRKELQRLGIQMNKSEDTLVPYTYLTDMAAKYPVVINYLKDMVSYYEKLNKMGRYTPATPQTAVPTQTAQPIGGVTVMYGLQNNTAIADEHLDEILDKLATAVANATTLRIETTEAQKQVDQQVQAEEVTLKDRVEKLASDIQTSIDALNRLNLKTDIDQNIKTIISNLLVDLSQKKAEINDVLTQLGDKTTVMSDNPLVGHTSQIESDIQNIQRRASGLVEAAENQRLLNEATREFQEMRMRASSLRDDITSIDAAALSETQAASYQTISDKVDSVREKLLEVPETLRLGSQELTDFVQARKNDLESIRQEIYQFRESLGTGFITEAGATDQLKSQIDENLRQLETSYENAMAKIRSTSAFGLNDAQRRNIDAAAQNLAAVNSIDAIRARSESATTERDQNLVLYDIGKVQSEISAIDAQTDAVRRAYEALAQLNAERSVYNTPTRLAQGTIDQIDSADRSTLTEAQITSLEQYRTDIANIQQDIATDATKTGRSLSEVASSAADYSTRIREIADSVQQILYPRSAPENLVPQYDQFLEKITAIKESLSTMYNAPGADTAFKDQVQSALMTATQYENRIARVRDEFNQLQSDSERNTYLIGQGMLGDEVQSINDTTEALQKMADVRRQLIQTESALAPAMSARNSVETQLKSINMIGADAETIKSYQDLNSRLNDLTAKLSDIPQEARTDADAMNTFVTNSINKFTELSKSVEEFSDKLAHARSAVSEVASVQYAPAMKRSAETRESLEQLGAIGREEMDRMSASLFGPSFGFNAMGEPDESTSFFMQFRNLIGDYAKAKQELEDDMRKNLSGEQLVESAQNRLTDLQKIASKVKTIISTITTEQERESLYNGASRELMDERIRQDKVNMLNKTLFANVMGAIDSSQSEDEAIKADEIRARYQEWIMQARSVYNTVGKTKEQIIAEIDDYIQSGRDIETAAVRLRGTAGGGIDRQQIQAMIAPYTKSASNMLTSVIQGQLLPKDVLTQDQIKMVDDLVASYTRYKASLSGLTMDTNKTVDSTREYIEGQGGLRQLRDEVMSNIAAVTNLIKSMDELANANKKAQMKPLDSQVSQAGTGIGKLGRVTLTDEQDAQYKQILQDYANLIATQMKLRRETDASSRSFQTLNQTARDAATKLNADINSLLGEVTPGAQATKAQEQYTQEVDATRIAISAAKKEQDSYFAETLSNANKSISVFEKSGPTGAYADQLTQYRQLVEQFYEMYQNFRGATDFSSVDDVASRSHAIVAVAQSIVNLGTEMDKTFRAAGGPLDEQRQKVIDLKGRYKDAKTEIAALNKEIDKLRGDTSDATMLTQLDEAKSNVSGISDELLKITKASFVSAGGATGNGFTVIGDALQSVEQRLTSARTSVDGYAESVRNAAEQQQMFAEQQSRIAQGDSATLLTRLSGVNRDINQIGGRYGASITLGDDLNTLEREYTSLRARAKDLANETNTETDAYKNLYAQLVKDIEVLQELSTMKLNEARASAEAKRAEDEYNASKENALGAAQGRLMEANLGSYLKSANRSGQFFSSLDGVGTDINILGFMRQLEDARIEYEKFKSDMAAGFATPADMQSSYEGVLAIMRDLTYQAVRLEAELSRSGEVLDTERAKAAYVKVEYTDMNATVKDLSKQMEALKGVAFRDEDKATIAETREQLASISQTLERFKKIDVSIGFEGLKERAAEIQQTITNVVNDINTKLGSVGANFWDTDGLILLNDAYNSGLKEIDQMMSRVQKSMENLGSVNWSDAAKEQVDELKTKYSELQRQVEEFKATSAGQYTTTASVNGAVSDILNFGNGLQASATEQFNNSQLKERVALLQQMNSLIQSTQKNAQKWKGAQFGSEKANYEKLVEQLQQLQALYNRFQSDSGLPAKQASKDFLSIKEQILDLSKTIRDGGGNIQSFGDRFKRAFASVSYMFSASRLIMNTIRQIRELINTTIELDDQMTQLRIVTQQTEEVYRRYADSIKSTAQSIGVEISDLVSATTTFARLGYNLDESSALAKYVGMLERVGDIDTQKAQDSVTSILKAFNIQIDEIESVMDKLVVVGNGAPVSVEQLADSMTNASSALAASGNSLEESIALITAANTTVASGGLT